MYINPFINSPMTDFYSIKVIQEEIFLLKKLQLKKVTNCDFKHGRVKLAYIPLNY